MSWGPIDRDWGEGWEDFDVDPFAEDPLGAPSTPTTVGARRSRVASVTRLPRPRPGKGGLPLDRSLTAPRPRSGDPRATRGYGSARAAGARVVEGRAQDPRIAPQPTAPPEPPRPRRAGRPAPARRPEARHPGARRQAPSRGPEPSRRATAAESTGGTPRLRSLPTGARAGSRAGGGGGNRRPPRAGAPRPDRRALLLKVFLSFLALAVVGKLIHVQVLEPDRFVEVGQSQRLRSVTLDADRGRILDREGHDLALSVLRPSIFADPSQIEDPFATATLLAPVLGIDVADLAADLSGDSQFVYLARRLDDAVTARVVELGLDGVHVVEEPARFTPSEDLARSIIGKVAQDQTGATGIELAYDDVLTGTAGEVTYERARDGGTIAAAGQSRIAPRAGDDVVLTLDRSLQYETERVLADQVDAMGAKGGMVAITNPATGEILAMANITRNTDGEIITAGANRAVIDVFEPGSVNKVITIAAALEEGLVEPDTTRAVPWRYQVSDHEFSDDHEHPTEQMTVTDILAESSNVGTIMLGQDLGKDRIDAYLREFGFGTRTALDFTNESPGILLDTDRWSGTSIGSIPIGQGIAVTAMQMLSAYNVIANDGVYVEPRLVAATVDADGVRTAVPTTEARRVVSPETAGAVRDMLVEAVERGTGTNARVEGYSVGGKTGTARKPQDTGTYQDLAGNYHYVAAFTGMVPAEDPELSIIVVIDEPTATIYGGSAAAPVFADLARFALNRFRIPPVSTPGR